MTGRRVRTAGHPLATAEDLRRIAGTSNAVVDVTAVIGRHLAGG